MTMGYYEVDDLVSDALERGDFNGAREFVLTPDASISSGDKRSLLETIAKAERSATEAAGA